MKGAWITHTHRPVQKLNIDPLRLSPAKTLRVITTPIGILINTAGRPVEPKERMARLDSTPQGEEAAMSHDHNTIQRDCEHYHLHVHEINILISKLWGQNFLKEIETFIQPRCIQLIKRES